MAGRLPWTSLGAFPTPVEPLTALSEGTRARLFVKRDDLSSPRYGGNKVRKLEFLLADASRYDCRTLITLGGIGSNHALATTIHGGLLGMQVDLALYDQPPSSFVTRNLHACLAAGARPHYAGNIVRAFLTSRRLYDARRRSGDAPYFVMVGGTSLLGCLGHVSAALELAEQVRRGELPEPDRVVVPLGTCGTAAGLIAGLRLAGLRTRVVAVRVADPISANGFVLRHLTQRVLGFLHQHDPAVPRLRIGLRDFDLVTDHFGPGYGHPTPEAEDAISRAESRLVLEPTYSGKALASCLDLCRRSDAERTVLFWNTFNSAALPERTSPPEPPTELPPELRRHLAT